jgi:hypothetical protein
MSVSGQENQVKYSTDGINDVFTFNQRIFAATDLKVQLVDTTTLVPSTLVLNSDYTVAIASDQNSADITTSVVYAAGYYIVITEEPAATQPANYSVGGDLDKNALQKDFDKMILHVLQLQRQGLLLDTDKSVDMTTPVRVPVGAGKFLQWSSDGLSLILADSSTTSDARVNDLFNGGNSNAIYPLRVVMPSGALIISGTGSPEGVEVAPVSSIFLRSDGGADTSIYFKETGAGNTGWVTKNILTSGVKTDNVTLKTKVVEIGAWDMDTVTNVTVLHGIADHTKIRSIDVLIRADSDGNRSQLNGADIAGTLGGKASTNSTTDILLQRTTGGTFDSASYNDTAGSYNRGWITIVYEA